MNQPSKEILIRYLKGECLLHEHGLVELYLSMDIDKEYVESCIATVWDELGANVMLHPNGGNLEMFHRQLDQRKSETLQLPPPVHQPENSNRFSLNRLSWIKIVAAMLILVGTAVLLVYQMQSRPTDTWLASKQDDMLPGSKALLTLSDGTTVALSSAKNGQIAVQGNLKVEKTYEGEIIYRTNGTTARNTNAFNSVVTPNGGQYRITLPDGSKAILNAASSITYPVHFSDKKRRIKMTGEVYFEIAKVIDGKNKRIPFFIETDKQEIQVLGTHFNVNAYADESIVKTTLVEGSVKVMSRQGQTVFLKPGQQALLSDQLRIETADIQRQLAWKNGDFIFKGENLQSVFRQLARWYDIEVLCPEHLENLRMNGMISRSKPLSTIIDMIETTHKNKITLTLKGRRLIVAD